MQPGDVRLVRRVRRAVLGAVAVGDGLGEVLAQVLDGPVGVRAAAEQALDVGLTAEPSTCAGTAAGSLSSSSRACSQVGNTTPVSGST